MEDFIETLLSRTLLMEHDGDHGFSEFRFFQSWASSCIDIDIDDVR